MASEEKSNLLLQDRGASPLQAGEEGDRVEEDAVVSLQPLDDESHISFDVSTPKPIPSRPPPSFFANLRSSFSPSSYRVPLYAEELSKERKQAIQVAFCAWCCLLACCNLPLTITGLVLGGQYEQVGSCNDIAVWTICMCALSVGLAILTLPCLALAAVGKFTGRYGLLIMQVVFGSFSAAWIIYGVILLFANDGCSDAGGPIFKFAVALVFISLITVPATIFNMRVSQQDAVET